jgi:putative acetyltransferase
MDELRVSEVDPNSPDAAELLAALDAYQSALYPPASAHLLPAAELAGPGAAFLGAFLAGRLVGCGGYVHRDGYGELKRLFVRPEVRGRGVGERLIVELERRARADGLSVLRLETGVRQPGAVRLYERLGYTKRGPFGEYSDDPLSVYMEKHLDGGR